MTGDDSTSSTVSGVRYGACGFRRAQLLAETATWASCSDVVPNWCMCRCAIKPVGLMGWIIAYDCS